MECPVCVERSPSLKKCISCDFSACKKCIKRFLLDSIQDPACMSCKKPWTRKFLIENLTVTFVNGEYKKHRQNILFELETALMPETQEEASRYKKNRDLTAKLATLKNQYEEAKIQRARGVAASHRFGTESFLRDSDVHLDDMHRLQKEIDLVTLQISINGMAPESSGSRIKTPGFVFKCPGADCKGYVTHGRCEMCEATVCCKCHEIRNPENHTCDPDTVKTVEMIRADTRNCPKCKVLIYKIAGCDQMFCVQCQTAFSWKTGEVVLGAIHNPHYFEWIARGGDAPRTIGDIPCGGLPDTSRYRSRTMFISDELHLRALRIANEIQFHHMIRYNIQINQIESNRSLRIRYLANEITEAEFKTKICTREKARNKFRDIIMILNTCLVVSSDIFRRIVEDRKDYSSEFAEIRDFTNQSLVDVSKTYQCMVPIIIDGWHRIDSVKY